MNQLVNLQQAFQSDFRGRQVMATLQESSVVSRKLFETAYAQKKAALKAGDLSGGRLGPFWDRLVFSKIRARLGGALFVEPSA